MSTFPIRLARPDDLPRIPEIEDDAGELYLSLGLDGVSEMPANEHSVIEPACREERLFVAVDEHDVAVAFALCLVSPDAVHLEELDVERRWSRRGIGARLIEHVVDWAGGLGRERVTLTTFRDVPWNAPYYERLGFRTLADAELDERLREIRAAEIARGLDVAPRVCMVRETRLHGTRP